MIHIYLEFNSSVNLYFSVQRYKRSTRVLYVQKIGKTLLRYKYQIYLYAIQYAKDV